jgi:hypothetical protein
MRMTMTEPPDDRFPWSLEQIAEYDESAERREYARRKLAALAASEPAAADPVRVSADNFCPSCKAPSGDYHHEECPVAHLEEPAAHRGDET